MDIKVDHVFSAYRDKCDKIYTGVKVEKPTSHNGTWDINVNWKKAEEYNREWKDWFYHESKTPEAREMFKALNKLAEQMRDEMAARQMKITKTAVKTFGAFLKWIEPGTKCDADAFLICLRGHDDWLSEDVYAHHCAREFGCRPDLDNHHAERHVRHDLRALRKASRQLMDEMANSFKATAISQEANAKQLGKDYLEECRVRWTKWGCNKKCVDKATRSFRHLKDINDCHCPDYITVSGDTRDLFN
jgi:hypothetical protein